jgi:PTH1 family peptidyl-tRNA hydrolase
MKVVVGLGNPGGRYAQTRHNVGFAVVERLAQSLSSGPFRTALESEIAQAQLGEQKVLLAKPQTFMNLCGRAVRRLVDYYGLPLENMLVVCDDVNLPLGQLRFRAKGSHGGHKGLQDIEQHLGTREYPRLRLGVGRPERENLADYVLDKFAPEERPRIEEALCLAAQAVEVWIRDGIEQCMNRFNARTVSGSEPDQAKE